MQVKLISGGSILMCCSDCRPSRQHQAVVSIFGTHLFLISLTVAAVTLHRSAQYTADKLVHY